MNHDRVELSINGSEDEFGEEDEETTESGEIVTEQIRSKQPGYVPSKIVRPQNDTTPVRSRIEKIAHLKSDPDFKDFLNELLDEREVSSHCRDDSQWKRSTTLQDRTRRRESDLEVVQIKARQ